MKALFTTNLGNFTVELNQAKAPITVANFVKYIEGGNFDGTIFHRVIDNFMVQGGGFDINMKQRETLAEIKNEANNGLKNDKYTLAMARTMQPHSASSQFFINVKDNDFLNFKSEDVHGWGYAVFGKVVEGTEVIDKMKTVKTTRKGMHDDVPVENIIIQKVTLINDKEDQQKDDNEILEKVTRM